jgi:hypothetical protein
MLLAFLVLGAKLMAQAPITADEVRKFALIMEDLEEMDEEGVFDEAFDDEESAGFSGNAMASAIILYGFENTVISRGLSVERFGEVAEKIYLAILRYALSENYEAQILMQTQYQAMVDQGLMTQEDMDTVMGAFAELSEGLEDLSDSEYEAVMSNWDLLDETLELED